MSEVLDEVVENLNLQDIDPTFKNIESGLYTLKVIRLQWTTPTGKKPYIKGQFAVQNHEKHSGRRLFKNFFPTNQYDLKELRRISDATGIQQESSFKEWLEKMSVDQPSIKVAVYERQATEAGPIDPNTGKASRVGKIGPTGEPVMENVIDFREVGMA